MFVIANEDNGHFVRHDSEGQHDGKTTADVALAKKFATYGTANAFNQNFDTTWYVVSEDGI